MPFKDKHWTFTRRACI